MSYTEGSFGVDILKIVSKNIRIAALKALEII